MNNFYQNYSIRECLTNFLICIYFIGGQGASLLYGSLAPAESGIR